MTTQLQSVITLDADNFDREVLQSDQAVLVDFWADWCPPCKAIGPVIEEVATEFEGIARVGKVDVDGNKSLADRYAIASIPSLLFFKDGEVVRGRRSAFAPGWSVRRNERPQKREQEPNPRNPTTSHSVIRSSSRLI